MTSSVSWPKTATYARVVRTFFICVAAVVGVAPLAPRADAAQPCPDVQVLFARGTLEPPGVGATGQAFVDALRARLGTDTVEVYAVDYVASLDFARAADGVADLSKKIIDVAATCADTRIVLGGFSQGAAVAAYTTTDTVTPGTVLPEGVTGPMPVEVARHVAAVVLFGKPHPGFLSFVDHDAPPITIGRPYAARTLDLCVPEDPVCSPNGSDPSAHGTYVDNGMTVQAADFAAGALSARTPKR